jgi:DNA-nicking Smr family endonuclease
MAKKIDDESRTFRAAVRDVKPLEAPPPPVGLVKPAPRPRKRRDVQDRATDAPYGAPPVPEVTVGAEESLEFRRKGVQDQVARRLRRALIPIDADLDLHGLILAEAWDALTQFLRASRESGHRCVRIVHGKGYRSGARGPVLKTAVDSWLRHNHDVMAFCSARALDGGSGALYVLLRA